MDESVLSVLATLVVATSVSLVSLSVQCAAQDACLKDGSCVPVDGWTCSFTNVVTEVGQAVFFANQSLVGFRSLSRGICPPGEAQTLVNDQLACTRRRCYPNAMNLEAEDTHATVPHERYCGTWIASQNEYNVDPVMMAFYDETLVADQVAEAVVAKYKVRAGASAPAKFRSACVRMVTSNSGGLEGKIAFEHLSGLLDTSSREALLRSVGTLAGHYCDAPAQIALTFGSGYRELAFNLTGGSSLSESDATAHLYAIGVDAQTRRMVAGFAARLQRMQPKEVSDEDARLVLHGVQGQTFKGDLRHLSRLIQAHAEDPEGAAAYLQGVAARCAFAAREAVFGGSGTQARKGLDQLPEADRFVTVDAAKLTEATSGTISSARAKRHLLQATRKQGVRACNDALLTFFPSHVDSVVFDTLVSRKLYERLGEATDELRLATSAALRGSVIGPTLGDAEAVSRAALEVDLRVAGAPVASWGGRFLPLSSPAFTSDDGALLMLLKAARSLFDRRSQLVSSGSVCDLPAVYPALSRNAYLFPSQRCGMLLPGLLVPPFADELYDDASLYARVGFVIAHEVAHVTAYAAWKAAEMAALLAGYPSSTHVEAIADLAAANAVMLTGKLNASELCAHQSQIWCGTTPRGVMAWLVSLAPGSHPAVNQRGDLICQFLDKHF